MSCFMDSMTVVSSNMYVHKMKSTLQTINTGHCTWHNFTDVRCIYQMHGIGMYVQVQVDGFVPFSQSWSHCSAVPINISDSLAPVQNYSDTIALPTVFIPKYSCCFLILMFWYMHVCSYALSSKQQFDKLLQCEKQSQVTFVTASSDLLSVVLPWSLRGQRSCACFVSFSEHVVKTLICDEGPSEVS